ncbi:MAG TPA: hypothetical protein VGC06_12000 [Actinomycetes bacterium]
MPVARGALVLVGDSSPPLRQLLGVEVVRPLVALVEHVPAHEATPLGSGQPSPATRSGASAGAANQARRLASCSASHDSPVDRRDHGGAPGVGSWLFGGALLCEVLECRVQ